MAPIGYTPLIGGAQGGLIRSQLQSRGISECLLTVPQVITAGLKGTRTCDF
ncbi:hypothetical protein D3C71_860490 [compost metagenome]